MPHEPLNPSLSLRPSALQMARPGEIRRVSKSGFRDKFQVFLGKPWEIEAVLEEDSSDVQVVAHTDIFSDRVGQFESAPLVRQASGHYLWRCSPSRAGIFHFQLRLSRDGGQTWRCERSTYGRIKVEPPSVGDLRMYTLIPRISGNFADWKKRLVGIQDMGFNAVHLLPITRMGKSRSPYAAHHLFEIDSDYVDPQDTRSAMVQFEAFVHEASRLGIRLCLDLVVNHVSVDGRMARQRPDWIVPDDHEADGFKRAGYWMGSKWIKWHDLALLDHRHPDLTVREELHGHMMQYAKFWAHYAAETDGMIRLDNAHSTDELFLKEMLNALRNVYPRLAVLAELFADPETSQRLVWDQGINLLLGTLWEMPYASQTRKLLSDMHHVHPDLRYHLPITSADSGSPAQEYGSDLATAARYAVAVFMGTGCTGMVQGVEWGVREKVSFIGQPSSPPPGFGKNHHGMIGRINQLHASEPVFHQTGNLRFVDGDHPAVVAALREDTELPGRYFLVVANLDVQRHQTVSLHGLEQLASARWTDVLSDRPASNGPSMPDFQLSPGEVRVCRIQAGPVGDA